MVKLKMLESTKKRIREMIEKVNNVLRNNRRLIIGSDERISCLMKNIIESTLIIPIAKTA